MMVAETSPRNRLDRVVRLPPGQFAPGVSGDAGGPQRAVRDVVAARACTHEAVATLVEVIGDTAAPDFVGFSKCFDHALPKLSSAVSSLIARAIEALSQPRWSKLFAATARVWEELPWPRSCAMLSSSRSRNQVLEPPSDRNSAIWGNPGEREWVTLWLSGRLTHRGTGTELQNDRGTHEGDER
jgi:hypothetical protein